MTLDEAIKHAIEVAEENQAIVDSCDYYGENMAKCEKCAKEHRQLATWLKELKQLREQMSSSEKPNKWIPMVEREPTDEEKAEYFAQHGEELCYMLENEMPLNGQEVLVSTKSGIYMDIFSEEFYNFEGIDIRDVTAWMPLPKAYKESEDKK